jgi:restriction system protein
MSMIADFQRLMQVAEEIPALPVALGATPRGDTPPFDEARFQALVRSAHSELLGALIARVHSQLPEFFENLVLDVLRAMGYGNKRLDMAQRLGRTGDGGIDGIIALDELGLDQVYIQAKRLRPGNPVPIGQVRDFAGSLEAKHASKGVFVTTTHFSPGAVEFCAQLSRRVVLIDGSLLTELMVRNNIGVKVQEKFYLKRIDSDYFSMPPPTRMAETISASIQPRR